MEPTVVLLAGALKSALDAGAGEAGKRIVAAGSEKLLGRWHPLRRKQEESGGLGPEDAEEFAAALWRGKDDPEVARLVWRLLDEAWAAGVIGRPELVAAGRPEAPGTFVNRVEELAELVELAGLADRAARVIVVGGRSGIGKTVLVDRIAAELFDAYLYIDASGAGGSGEIARRLLERIGVDTGVARPDAEWVALWHVLSGDRRYCLVLDDVTQPGQVRPFVPKSGGGLLVAISSEPLGELLGAGAQFVEVERFDTESAVALLRVLVRAAVGTDDEAFERIAEACDGIPRVLGLAAGVLSRRGWSAAELAESFEDGARQMSLLRQGGREVVELVFDAGYRELEPATRTVYHALAHLSGDDFQTGALAALAGVPESEAVYALDELVGKYIVGERVRPDVGYRVGGMQRNHAREMARQAGEYTIEARTAARRRLRDMLVENIQHADTRASSEQPLRYPELDVDPARNPFAGSAQALEWVDAMRPHLLTCVEESAAVDDDAVLRIAGSMWPYVTNYRRWHDGAVVFRAAAEAARRGGDRAAEARNLCSLSRCLLEIGDHAGAREAVAVADRLTGDADARLRGSVAEFVGLVALAEGRYEEAYGLFVEAKRLHETTRDVSGAARRGEVLALQMAGRALRSAKEFERAIEVLSAAVALVRPGDVRLRARLGMDLAEAYLNVGRGADAVPLLEAALPLLDAQKMAGDLATAEWMLRTARRSG